MNMVFHETVSNELTCSNENFAIQSNGPWCNNNNHNIDLIWKMPFAIVVSFFFLLNAWQSDNELYSKIKSFVCFAAILSNRNFPMDFDNFKTDFHTINVKS